MYPSVTKPTKRKTKIQTKVPKKRTKQTTEEDLLFKSKTADFSTDVNLNVDVTVVMRNQQSKICEFINNWNGGFICVAMAWFTNFDILQALVDAQKKRNVLVLVVVQKEDFLRPDHSKKSFVSWSRKLRNVYKELGVLSCQKNRITQLLNLTANNWIVDEKEDECVRCLGNYNSKKDPCHPRMHHKFLVFGWFTVHQIPYSSCVWTGSYNFSKNSEQSYENAVLIKSTSVSASYLKEFITLFKLSEPLDWTSKWMITPL